jgi:hypothetical protein
MDPPHAKVDKLMPQFEAPSKASGLTATQMAVVSSSIVKDLDAIKNINMGQVSSFVNTLLDTLFF